MDKFIDLPMQMRTAEIRAGSFNEADNSIALVWSTGARVRRYSWREGAYYDEELSMDPGAVILDRMNRGAPLLNSHDDYNLSSVIGVIVDGSARIENGVGVARARLSSTPADADIVAKVRDGLIRNTSVGYAVHEIQKTIVDDGSVPVWRATSWEPFEVSLVAIPADAASQIRSAEAEKNERCFRAIVRQSDAPQEREKSSAVRRARMAIRSVATIKV